MGVTSGGGPHLCRTLRDCCPRPGWDYPSGIDQNGAITIEYGVKGLPEKFFVDQNGSIVKKFIGPISVNELTSIINDMLANPPEPLTAQAG